MSALSFLPLLFSPVSASLSLSVVAVLVVNDAIAPAHPMGKSCMVDFDSGTNGKQCIGQLFYEMNRTFTRVPPLTVSEQEFQVHSAALLPPMFNTGKKDSTHDLAHYDSSDCQLSPKIPTDATSWTAQMELNLP